MNSAKKPQDSPPIDMNRCRCLPTIEKSLGELGFQFARDPILKKDRVEMSKPKLSIAKIQGKSQSAHQPLLYCRYCPFCGKLIP